MQTIYPYQVVEIRNPEKRCFFLNGTKMVENSIKIFKNSGFRSPKLTQFGNDIKKNIRFF